MLYSDCGCTVYGDALMHCDARLLHGEPAGFLAHAYDTGDHGHDDEPWLDEDSEAICAENMLHDEHDEHDEHVSLALYLFCYTLHDGMTA
jgi:hypothetical protein